MTPELPAPGHAGGDDERARTGMTDWRIGTLSIVHSLKLIAVILPKTGSGQMLVVTSNTDQNLGKVMK